jgi:plasmid stabilization system protein ParE
MARRVVWSPRALADVEAIATYIASDSPFYAGSVVRRILSLTRTLETFPLAGRKFRERLVCPHIPLSPHFRNAEQFPVVSQRRRDMGRPQFDTI